VIKKISEPGNPHIIIKDGLGRINLCSRSSFFVHAAVFALRDAGGPWCICCDLRNAVSGLTFQLTRNPVFSTSSPVLYPTVCVYSENRRRSYTRVAPCMHHTLDRVRTNKQVRARSPCAGNPVPCVWNVSFSRGLSGCFLSKRASEPHVSEATSPRPERSGGERDGWRRVSRPHLLSPRQTLRVAISLVSSRRGFTRHVGEPGPETQLSGHSGTRAPSWKDLGA
jgi:hypothetical protein